MPLNEKQEQYSEFNKKRLFNAYIQTARKLHEAIEKSKRNLTGNNKKRPEYNSDLFLLSNLLNLL